jgi:hypothetical protein
MGQVDADNHDPNVMMLPSHSLHLNPDVYHDFPFQANDRLSFLPERSPSRPAR